MAYTPPTSKASSASPPIKLSTFNKLSTTSSSIKPSTTPQPKPPAASPPWTNGGKNTDATLGPPPWESGGKNKDAQSKASLAKAGSIKPELKRSVEESHESKAARWMKRLKTGGAGSTQEGSIAKQTSAAKVQPVRPKVAKRKLLSNGLERDEAEAFKEAVKSAGGDLDGGSWEVACARGWRCLRTLLQDEACEEEANCDDQRLSDAAAQIGYKQVPEQLDAEFAQQLYRRGHYFAHYLYLSDYPEFDKNVVVNRAQDNELIKVLMVAEKPSIAKIITEHLSNGRFRTRRTCSRACQTYEFIRWCPHLNAKAKVIVTSTIGHVFNLTFERQRGMQPEDLFTVKTVKEVEESSAKNRVVEHLRELAADCQQLVLWLDCDREGENICFEIIGICREHFPSDKDIYRAKFSALTQVEIKGAFQELGKPNKHMAMAVDARQELDLRVGVAFTRLLTWSFLDHAKAKFPRYKDLKVLSYGPCQTPTLWFVVERHKQIQKFIPEEYWILQFMVEVGGQVHPLPFKCAEEEKIWDGDEAQTLFDLVRKPGTTAKVESINEEPRRAKRPVGLNTVQLLKAASTGLGISPGNVMRVAESLYSHGYISYPRTETSRYPSSFDVTSVLQELTHHPTFGKSVNWLLKAHGGRVKPPTEGHDAGDHPPITPMRLASRADFMKAKSPGKEWKIYDLVCSHFIASLMPDVEYTEHTLTVDVQGKKFASTWHTVLERGFLFAMPYKEKELKLRELNGDSADMGKGKGKGGKRQQIAVPKFNVGQRLRVSDARLDDDCTKHPEYLKESELISLMDKKGIGTDATMAQHIDNVVARHYVKVCEPSEEPGKPGPEIRETKGWNPKWNKGKGKGGKSDGGPPKPKARHMVPTGLGLAILDMFHRIVPDLCEPPVRAFMEKQCAQVADGVASQDAVVKENIELFQDKFFNFQNRLPSVAHILAPKGDAWDDWSDSRSGGGGSWKSGGKSSGGKSSGGGKFFGGKSGGSIKPVSKGGAATAKLKTKVWGGSKRRYHG